MPPVATISLSILVPRIWSANDAALYPSHAPVVIQLKQTETVHWGH